MGVHCDAFIFCVLTKGTKSMWIQGVSCLSRRYGKNARGSGVDSSRSSVEELQQESAHRRGSADPAWGTPREEARHGLLAVDSKGCTRSWATGCLVGLLSLMWLQYVKVFVTVSCFSLFLHVHCRGPLQRLQTECRRQFFTKLMVSRCFAVSLYRIKHRRPKQLPFSGTYPFLIRLWMFAESSPLDRMACPTIVYPSATLWNPGSSAAIPGDLAFCGGLRPVVDAKGAEKIHTYCFICFLSAAVLIPRVLCRIRILPVI